MFALGTVADFSDELTKEELKTKRLEHINHFNCADGFWDINYVLLFNCRTRREIYSDMAEDWHWEYYP